MLEPFAPLLARGPVGAFACYELAMAEGVLRAAVRGRVVMLVAGTALRASGAERLVAALRGAAQVSRAQVSLQADHVHDLETVELALELGVQAVMADSRRCRCEGNVAFTREAVALAREFGAAVEGELGRLAGGVDADAPRTAEARTDPGRGRRVRRRAPASTASRSRVGNVHGALLPAPASSWTGRAWRRSGARSTCRSPCTAAPGSMAPSSGARCASGIAKVNVNTALRARVSGRHGGGRWPSSAQAGDLVALHARQARRGRGRRALDAWGSCGRADNSDRVGRL